MERVIDIYDDGGRSLAVMGAGAIPSWVKSATHISDRELSRLPDDLFALILTKQGSRIRKFACVDPASTEVSGAYLILHHQNLPSEAVKVAARNLCAARNVYGLPEHPTLLLLSKTGGDPIAGYAPSDGKGLIQAEEPREGRKTEDRAVRGTTPDNELQMPSRSFKTPQPEFKDGESAKLVNDLTDELLQYIEGRRVKKADLTGTEVMPVGQVKEKPKEVKKLAAVYNVVEDGPTLADRFPEQFGLVKHAHFLRGRPVDSLNGLLKEQEKFEKKAEFLPAQERHNTACELRGHLESLGLPVSAGVLKYASDHYRSADELAAAVIDRTNLGNSLGVHVDYADMHRAYGTFLPSTYATKLANLDRKYGLDRYWDNRIENPWSATMALEKQATIVYSKGDVFVSDNQLQELAQKEREALTKILDDDVIEEFCRNPVDVFKSLPDPLKKVIGRLAMDPEWRGEVR